MSMQPTTHPQQASRAGNLNKSIQVGLLAGVMWAVAQFAISEMLYRLSMAPISWRAAEPLEMLSNAISWPAGTIYERVEADRMQAAIASALADGAIEEETRTRLVNLEKDGAVDVFHEDFFELFEILENLGHDVEVPVSMEYMIYGGVCVIWGMLVGVLTGALFWRFYHPVGSPPPLRQV